MIEPLSIYLTEPSSFLCELAPTEQWQLIGEDQWVFGTLIRGIVRKVRAEIYFNKDSDDRRGGWVWFLHGELPLTTQPPRGVAANRLAAIAAAEQAMGIES